MPKPHSKSFSCRHLPKEQETSCCRRPLKLSWGPSPCSTNRTPGPSHAFFLTSGLASVLAVTTVGLASEIGVIGRGGFTGGLHLIGPVDTPTHCRMQLAGARPCRSPFEHLQKAFHQDDDLHRHMYSSLSRCIPIF